MWIPRGLSQKIQDLNKKRPVILLTGARQTGKSSLLQHLFPDADYVTLDNLIDAEEAESNPVYFLSQFKKQVIIDEIQYVPNLLRELKIIVDQNREQYGQWILTGSQQFPLMKGVSESLAGRVSVLELDTLSAREIRGKDILNQSFLWRGGYPEIWAQSLDSQEFFLSYIALHWDFPIHHIR